MKDPDSKMKIVIDSAGDLPDGWSDTYAINIIPIQNIKTQKNSPIPRFMACTDCKTDPTDRIGGPSGEKGMVKKKPLTT